MGRLTDVIPAEASCETWHPALSSRTVALGPFSSARLPRTYGRDDKWAIG
jgi:hypothetical protein